MSGKGKEPMDLPEVDPAFQEDILAMSNEDRVALAKDLMARFQLLMELQSEMLDDLWPPDIRKRVALLLEIQDQYDEQKKKYLKEKAALEAKYQKIYEPFYARRYEIVNGIEEVEGVENETKGKAPAENNASKGVPGFWLTAMKYNVVLAKVIQKRDEGALEYLKDIKWCETDDPKGFKLDFFFDTNPYFQNAILTKTYEMADENEKILVKAIGTEIEWHPGKCLSQTTVKKKSKKGSKHAMPITKTEKSKSFFSFFNPPEIPADDVEIGDYAAKKLQDQVDQDYDIVTVIRDKIIPRAVLCFTGDIARKIESTDLEDEVDDEEEDKQEEKDQ